MCRCQNWCWIYTIIEIMNKIFDKFVKSFIYTSVNLLNKLTKKKKKIWYKFQIPRMLLLGWWTQGLDVSSSLRVYIFSMYMYLQFWCLVFLLVIYWEVKYFNFHLFHCYQECVCFGGKKRFWKIFFFIFYCLNVL